jgi:hypothetical protein
MATETAVDPIPRPTFAPTLIPLDFNGVGSAEVSAGRVIIPDVLVILKYTWNGPRKRSRKRVAIRFTWVSEKCRHTAMAGAQKTTSEGTLATNGSK